MTDFFDRLLARQQPLDAPGAVTRARPRVPTLFERTRAAELEEISLERDAAAPPVVVPAPPAAAPRATPVHVAAPASPAPPGRSPAPVTESGPAAVAAALAPVPGRPPALAPPPVVVHPPLVPPPVSPGAEPASAAVPAVAALPAAPQLVAPAAPRVAPAAPVAAPGATVTAGPDGRMRRAEPPERTVRVHIGRIEVSAPPGPAAKPDRARRRAPDLTLDKYLGEGNAS